MKHNIYYLLQQIERHCKEECDNRIVIKSYVGKIVALVLMLVGIGVIGMLTSSITTYFVREDKKADNKDVQLEKIMQKLDKIEKQNYDLKEEIKKLKQKY